HWWMLPLASLIAWYGMLIAMLACWSFQGHPIYWFMDVRQFPVYISDIGATNLKPLFISCAGFQGLAFFLTLCCERYLRAKQKLIPNFNKKEVVSSYLSIFFCAIGELGILFVSIFDTHLFHTVHITMVGIFISFMFFSCFSLIFEYFSLGRNYYRKFNVKKYNYLMLSAITKLIWCIFAMGLAIGFGVCMRKRLRSQSAALEWTLSFWYGVFLMILIFDLYPASTKKHGYEFRDYDEY
ncbi:Sfk1p ASCRUDRAFT_20406, partial [Ascoidea rubescens DSM 1968]